MAVSARRGPHRLPLASANLAFPNLAFPNLASPDLASPDLADLTSKTWLFSMELP